MGAEKTKSMRDESPPLSSSGLTGGLAHAVPSFMFGCYKKTLSFPRRRESIQKQLDSRLRGNDDWVAVAF